ncbi:GIY-YIG nuclease family protein [Shewanella sp.]|uniref:GIY-YIG nuclease family protein n=1 Tax=Shewanella sp. TaxID=50422 RepID=UPI0035614125
MDSQLKQFLNWGSEHPVKTAVVVVGTVVVTVGVAYIAGPYLCRLVGPIGAGLAEGMTSKRKTNPQSNEARQASNFQCKACSPTPDIDTVSKTTLETGLAGSALKPGRPCQHESCNSIEKGLRGVYRIKDEDNTPKYIGKTVDMRRRCQEHSRSGVFNEDCDRFEVLPAKQEASIIQLFAAEREQIKRHSPYLNKTAGGNGR